MEIKVKLYGTLRDRCPKGTPLGAHFPLEITSGSTVNDILEKLNITLDEAKVVIINSNIVQDYSFQLNESDLFVCFPPVGGG